MTYYETNISKAAPYKENRMFEPEIAIASKTIANIKKNKNRLIIAIAGPPAAGKSTFSAELCKSLRSEYEPKTELVPMDGFHYDNQILIARDQLHRKGAPFTFDAQGVVSLVKRIKAGEDAIAYPIFDRAMDCAIAGAGLIIAETKIILIEGNYLLLQEHPWQDLAPLFDLTIMISAPAPILEQRLIQRWLDHDHSLDDAKKRALSNDIPNAHYVTKHSAAAALHFNNQ